MAYKNRALDHFIDQCRVFCPLMNIVRIGHISEGYEHLRETLLSVRVRQQGGSRSYRLHRQKLDSLYQRYVMKVQVLSYIVKEQNDLETWYSRPLPPRARDHGLD